MYLWVLLIKRFVPTSAPYSTNTEAPTSYGDALVRTHKYKYGILAYEAAITAHKLLQSCLHDALVRRLATVCLDNGDVDRALKYVWCLPFGTRAVVCATRVLAMIVKSRIRFPSRMF